MPRRGVSSDAARRQAFEAKETRHRDGGMDTLIVANGDQQIEAVGVVRRSAKTSVRPEDRTDDALAKKGCDDVRKRRSCLAIFTTRHCLDWLP